MTDRQTDTELQTDGQTTMGKPKCFPRTGDGDIMFVEGRRTADDGKVNTSTLLQPVSQNAGKG